MEKEQEKKIIKYIRYEPDIIRCSDCNNSLYVYSENVLYCPYCDEFAPYYMPSKIKNKVLTLSQKEKLNNRGL